MIALDLAGSLPAKPIVLCLGAHCDDIEIGCGGTLLRLLRARADVTVRWTVFSSTPTRAREAEAAAAIFLKRARVKDVRIHRFDDGHFPYQGAGIKKVFEELKRGPAPDLVFTHYRDDRHQDHRVISDTTWQTFRESLVLEYEIPKYDGDLGSPNVFLSLDAATCERKIRALVRSYPTQQTKAWFTEETLRALLRLRGIESRTQYAEAFYGRKVLL